MPDEAEPSNRAERFIEPFRPWWKAVEWIAHIEGCGGMSAFRKLCDALSLGYVEAVDGRAEPLSHHLFPDRLEKEVCDDVNVLNKSGDSSSYADMWRRPEQIILISWESLLKLWPPKRSSSERPGSPVADDETKVAPFVAQQPNANENLVPEPKPSAPELRRASDNKINEAISALYDETEARKEKPPNVKEVVLPVRSKLAVIGLEASGRRIQELAEADVYKKRRRKPGLTVANEERKREL